MLAEIVGVGLAVDRRPRHRLEERPRPRDPVLQIGEARLLVGEGSFATPPIRTAANFAVSLARCTCPVSVSMSGASRAPAAPRPDDPLRLGEGRPFSSSAAERVEPAQETGTVMS